MHVGHTFLQYPHIGLGVTNVGDNLFGFADERGIQHDDQQKGRSDATGAGEQRHLLLPERFEHPAQHRSYSA